MSDIFLLGGNTVHFLAFYLILYEILKKGSSTGISGKTQILYLIIFLSRYTDLFTNRISFYNTLTKIVFIILTTSCICLIYGTYKKSFDRENDSFPIWKPIVPAALLATCFNYCTLNSTGWYSYSTPQEVLWTFSIYLEVVAILPQYYMSLKSAEGWRMLPYIVALFAYRALYICHWIYRYYDNGHSDPISSISGSLQTIILLLVAIDVHKLKKNTPKWQEITEVFVVEAEKEDPSEKILEKASLIK